MGPRPRATLQGVLIERVHYGMSSRAQSRDGRAPFPRSIRPTGRVLRCSCLGAAGVAAAPGSARASQPPRLRTTNAAPSAGCRCARSRELSFLSMFRFSSPSLSVRCIRNSLFGVCSSMLGIRRSLFAVGCPCTAELPCCAGSNNDQRTSNIDHAVCSLNAFPIPRAFNPSWISVKADGSSMVLGTL